jgi:hypothetical protein
MTRIRNSILCFSTLVVLSFVCSLALVPSSVMGSSYIVEHQSVPNFWGGGICAKPNGTTCRKCCNYSICYDDFEPECDEHKISSECIASGAYETQNITDGWSCKDTNVKTDSCEKTNWGDCSTRYKCYWNAALGECDPDDNNNYKRQSYLDCD